MAQYQSNKINLSALEDEIYKLWIEEDTFKETLELSKNRPQFNFYDGPPFATGNPHYGHLLAGAIKDTICRFQTLNGKYVPRVNGWDTHGLPIEQLCEKTLGIKNSKDIEKIGVDKFNEKCRSLVLQCAENWEEIIPRFGRWIDFENGYKTMDFEYMNAVWSVFKTIWNKGLVYQSLTPMPFSTGCGSCLSHFEAKSNYQDTTDPSVYVLFRLNEMRGIANINLLVWTTTPYSLTGNLAVCINPDLTYVVAVESYTELESNENIIDGNPEFPRFLMMAENVFKTFELSHGLRITSKWSGKELLEQNLTYTPPFTYNNNLETVNKPFRVVGDSYVKTDTGTGIVHLAPGMGEDDYRICLREGIINPREITSIPCPIDEQGCLTIEPYEGIYVKDADKLIIKDLDERGLLFESKTIKHSYPFCYRTDTPLIQKAVQTWFIDVHHINERIIQLNKENINWIPSSVGNARFAQWLETPRDWSFGRSRYWGTPVPIWTDELGDEIICISSVIELEDLSGLPRGTITDLHKDKIDHIQIPSQKNPGTWLKRIPDVFDCWFESGSMPYGKFAVEQKLKGDEIYNILNNNNEINYHELKVKFYKSFPADFIGEGIDQTRGWFYTLLVLSTILLDNTAYYNVVVNGHILASEPGKNGRWVKMSKRHQNYTSPMEAIKKYGADSIRLYLLDSPVSHGEALKFNENGLLDKGKFLVQWYNCYQFLEQEIKMLKTQNTEFKFNIIPTNQIYDHWILGKLMNFVKTCQYHYSNYDLYKVIPEMLGFEELFSKWYINLSKTKMKGNIGLDIQLETLSTFWTVLYTFSVLMSPVTPFMSEIIYRDLIKLVSNFQRDDDNFRYPKSVHQIQLITDVIPRISGNFNSDMANMANSLVDVVVAVRTLKTQLGQSARLRSSELLIQSGDIQFLDNVKQLEKELRTVVKVSQITYEYLDMDKMTKMDIKFNVREISKLARAKSKDVLNYLNSLNVSELMNCEDIIYDDVCISSNLWEIIPCVDKLNNIDNKMVSIYYHTSKLLVSLSRETSMTPAEIQLEDLLKEIQKVKKNNGLRPENVVDIYLRIRNNDLLTLFNNETDYINERLRSKIHLGELPNWGIIDTHRHIYSATTPYKNSNDWTFDIYLQNL